MTSVRDPEDSPRLRRYRDMLSTSGLAIIVFSLWDIAKVFLTSIYGSAASTNNRELPHRVETALEAFRGGREGLLIAVIIAVTLLLLATEVLRFYVGLSARAEAGGKRKSWAYVIIAGVMAAMSAALMVAGLLLAREMGNVLRSLVTGVIDLTSLLAYVDLIRSAIVVKRLARRQRPVPRHARR